jgi:hypothetical protein
MKLQFEQALQMLEQQGRPSIFRVLMQPMSPTIIHMSDMHISEKPMKPAAAPATLVPLEDAVPEPVTPEPVTPEPVTPEPVTPEPVTPEPVTPEPDTVPLTPPSSPDTPRPVIFVTPMRYEFHTEVVLKKWWRALTCRNCKTESIGFKPTTKRPV